MDLARGKRKVPSRSLLYRTTCGHSAWLQSMATGGRHVTGAVPGSACTVMPYEFHASCALRKLSTVYSCAGNTSDMCSDSAGKSAACCRVSFSDAALASASSGVPPRSASHASRGHDTGVAPPHGAALPSPPSGQGSDAMRGCQGLAVPSARSATSHNAATVSSPNAVNMRYASPRGPGIVSACSTVNRRCAGMAAAMSPAGMSADAAAPRPVPGNRAGATERDSLDDDDEEEEDDAPTPPSARSHATVASAMPPSAGGAAVGTDAFPLTSAVPSGGASAASQSARAASSVAAAAPGAR